MAAGNWILKPEYLSESVTNGTCLNEIDFEWYGEGTVGQVWRGAPRKNRLNAEKGIYSYSNMIVTVYKNNVPTEDVMSRLIPAGKGTYLPLSNLDNNNIKNIQNTFIGKKLYAATDLTAIDETLIKLKKLGFILVKGNYFVHVITNEAPDIIDKYIVN